LGRGAGVSSHLLGSILAIGLSLIPLIVVLEVADGMIEGITRRYLEVGTYHLQISLAGEADLGSYQTLREQILSKPGVKQAFIERQGMGMLYTQRGRSAVTVRAVPPSMYADDEGFRKFFTIVEGSFDLEQADDVLLGQEVAARIGAGVGERVKLLSLVSLSGSRSLPKVSSFTVQGIFSTGYQELDKLWTYIPLRSGVRVLPADRSAQFVGVKLDDPFDKINRQVASLRADLPGEVQIASWFQLERANYKSFQTTKALLLFIMALIVIVATINISSALIMIVLEKREEIGILKAMGARPRDISLAFLFTGLLAGIVGALLGLGLGLTVAVNINHVLRGIEGLVNQIVKVFMTMVAPFGGFEASTQVRVFNTEFYLEQIPIQIKGSELWVVACLTMLLSTVAAFLPARSAARIRPLDVLRKI